MKLSIIVRLTQKEKATIIGDGREIPASPMHFKISKKTAGIIARMAGKIEVMDNEISAICGGFGSDLHVPYRLNVGAEVAQDITAGKLKIGGNVDYIFAKAKIALDKNDAEGKK